MSKIVTSIVVLAVLVLLGGFIAMGVWDMPIKQKEVEVPVKPS